MGSSRNSHKGHNKGQASTSSLQPYRSSARDSSKNSSPADRLSIHHAQISKDHNGAVVDRDFTTPTHLSDFEDSPTNPNAQQGPQTVVIPAGSLIQTVLLVTGYRAGSACQGDNELAQADACLEHEVTIKPPPRWRHHDVTVSGLENLTFGASGSIAMHEPIEFRLSPDGLNYWSRGHLHGRLHTWFKMSVDTEEGPYTMEPVRCSSKTKAKMTLQATPQSARSMYTDAAAVAGPSTGSTSYGQGQVSYAPWGQTQ